MCGLLPKFSLNQAAYRSILLDFDGTIVPSERVFLQSWQEVFKTNYHCIFTESEYIRYELEEDAKLVNYLVINNKLPPDIDIKMLMQDVYDNYTFGFRDMLDNNDFTKTLDHILQWGNAGIKLGIVSTSRRNYIEMFFEKYKNYRSLFSCIFCREDVKELKPNPMVYLLAANKLRTSPPNCVVIEDSLKGIEGATAAQMKVIRVLKNTFDVDIYTQGYDIPTVNSIEDIAFTST